MFENLFESFNSSDSYAILFIILIAFLLGLLVMFFLRSSPIRRMRREMNEKKKEVDRARKEVGNLKEQLELKEADLQRVNFEAEELSSKVNALETEKTQLYNDIYTLNTELEKHQASIKVSAETVEELNDQIIYLKAQNEKLLKEKEAGVQALDNLDQIEKNYAATRNKLIDIDKKLIELENAKGSLAKLEFTEQQIAEFQNIKAEISSLKATEKKVADLEKNNISFARLEATEKRLAELEGSQKELERLKVLEEKLVKLEDAGKKLNTLEEATSKINRLVGDNQILKADLEALRSLALTNQKILAGGSPAPIMTQDHPVENNPEPDIIPDLTLNSQSVLGDRISVEYQQRDSLTKIEGLGSFLENRLNDMGIYTYEQISKWDESTINEVTQEIGYIEGRIAQDNWVGQAQKLFQAKQNKRSSLTKAIMPTNAHPEDLKIVEGIGPKIEAVLKEAGINDWAGLAKAEVAWLRDVLATAGDRFRVHDPSTWPDQARLAANGEWDLLKEYQDELIGGRNQPK